MHPAAESKGHRRRRHRVPSSEGSPCCCISYPHVPSPPAAHLPWHHSRSQKVVFVDQLLAAKAASGKTFGMSCSPEALPQLCDEFGLTTLLPPSRCRRHCGRVRVCRA